MKITKVIIPDTNHKSATSGKHTAEKHSFVAGLLRFFGLWFVFSWLYGISAVCPFCGRVGCPVGAGSAGFVGAFFALCTQNWKALVGFVHSKLHRKTVNT